MSHTPTPWMARIATNQIGDSFPGYWTVEAGNVRIADLFGEVIGEKDESGDDKFLSPEQIEANAEFICRAINSHADLLAACKLTLAWIDQIYPDDVFTGESGDEGVLRIVEIRNSTRAAIASAEKA